MATKTKTTEAKTGAFNGLNGQPYEAILFSSKEQLEKAMKASAEAFEKAFSMSKDRFDVLTKSVDDAAKLGKEQVDALVSASNVAAKGIETINAEVMAFTKHQIEDQISATKAMMGAKTLQELIELQNDFAKNAFEAYTAHTTKLSEVAAKTAQEAFAPINTQLQAAVEKMVKPLAA
ncbi:MAG TPA: phasin family protein [Ferrovibrio sp.]|jgi:phasin family protein|uniref:phasin family protein n=1 Tax=Ferrovibrio sp. TaxID=1917215 RepID=UPI002B4B5323|nr:phasin family protein [Ferrovibrio sp.]HLT78933.1 phasin family protein [Ferrovibrio sp.]